jgi:urease accessory protein
MLRAVNVVGAGCWTATPADTVTLDHDHRHRRRILLTSDGGREFLLDLGHTVALRHGDGLELNDGSVVAVHASAEPLLEVRARDASHLVRLAWHLGNRHLEAQIEPERILIRPDHVIADMLAKLGATVTPVTEPFQPEAGAYAHGHGSHR